MNCLITWDGECDVHGKLHACVRDSEFHPGKHRCDCGARTAKFLNDPPPPPPPREPAAWGRFGSQPVRRPKRRLQRRDPTHYWPKYMKRKRGIS